MKKENIKMLLFLGIIYITEVYSRHYVRGHFRGK